MYALTVEGAILELWMEECLEKMETDEAQVHLLFGFANFHQDGLPLQR